MKYVTGSNENIRVIELPDDARPLTADDEAVLAAREAERISKEQAYREKVAQAEAKWARDKRIGELKRLLSRTDYQAIKFAEGEMTQEEYAPIRAERTEWRREINELEGL